MFSFSLGWWFCLLMILPSVAIPKVITDHVVDGDTIALTMTELPSVLQKVSVRVDGIDTPESNYLAKCDKEKELGLKAKEFTKSMVANGKIIKYDLLGWDKYGGRILGNVTIDKKSLAKALMDAGLAREYHGEAKKSWCD